MLTNRTLAPIDPRTMNGAVELLAIRRGALDDLKRMPACKVNSDWQRDRVRDVDYANRQLDALARRLGLDVAELVDRAEDAAQALAN